MKRLTLSALAAVTAAGMWAQMPDMKTRINIQGTDYTITKVIERQIGPGTVYTRMRLPGFPLNVNMVVVDTHNPNIKIETNLPNDKSAGTELLTAAAKRHDAPNHHAITAQNGNFWIVSTQPQWDAYGASTHGVNMRNGMLAIDSKSMPPWWWWNSEQGGIVGCTELNELWIDVCKTVMTYTTEKLGTREYICCNKGFRPGETAIYTPWYGTDRQFLPLRDNNANEFITVEDQECTEVLLQIADGQQWTSGSDMNFVVKEVRNSNGRGTLGNYDLAIVARQADVHLETLAVGENVKLNYSWIFNRDGKEVTPAVSQAIGGNLMVMKDGEVTEWNDWDSYNTMVYSRSAYGTSKDNRYLYMLVIDKSNDPVYGASNGCTTREMIDIMKYLGAWNVINVDAGGSAELMVDGKITNKTTEGTPRAVGNGWIVFNTAPDDDTEVASLAFYDLRLSAPIYSTFSPRVVAYNKYGTVLNDDYKDFEITTVSDLGYGSGNTFACSGTPGTVNLVISAPNGATCQRELNIVQGEAKLRLSTIIVDENHPYLMQVKSTLNEQEFDVEPWRVMWTVADESIARVNEHGMLVGLKNGNTTINGKMTGMDQTAEVRVENAPTPVLSLVPDWAAWTVKGNSGLKLGTVGADGTIPYTYNSPRNQATITLTGDLTLFGLPQSVAVEFTSSVPVNSVNMELRAAGVKSGQLTYKPDEALVAGQMHTLRFNTSDLGDKDDNGLYPLSLGAIKINMPANSQYKGEQTLYVTAIQAEYTDQGGVDDITVDAAAQQLVLTPNPVAPGEMVSAHGVALKSAVVYNAAGAAVSTATADGDTLTLTAPQAAGMYIVRATAANGTVMTGRLLVK